MGKLKKITSRLFKTGSKPKIGNGLYASLEELMDMRKFAGYLQTSRKIKSFSTQVGDIRSVFKGRGIEMEEIREYAFGDDVRDIDWRVTARKEKPYTKIYLEERDREIYAWLDLSPLMLFGSSCELKAVTAAKIAALLGWVSLNNKDRFGCVIFDGRQSWLFKAKNDRAYLAAVLKKTAEVSLGALSNTEISAEEKVRSLKWLQANAKSKASVFLISSFGGWGAEFEHEIAALTQKSRLFLINVFDKLEEKAPTAGQYMAEYRGQKLILDSSNKTYRKEYAAYFAQKHEQQVVFCRRLGCRMIDFSSEMSFIGGLKIFQRKS